jgi:uroporphyrinogen decarboxylase
MSSEMTSVERVLTVLQGREPDRVPTFEWLFDRQLIQKLCPNGDLFDFVEQAGLDGVAVYADYQKEWLTQHTYVDEWGITMTVMTEAYPVGVDFPLKDPEQLASLTPPDPCAEARFASLRQAVKRFKGKRAILFRLRDAYSLPRYLRGTENLMMDLILHPNLVHALVDMSVEYYTRMAHRAMELGADVLWTSDDYCDNRGPIMGAKRWRQFFLPGLRRLVKHLKDAGYPFIKHCDGYIEPIIADLVDAGIDCIDPIDVGAGMRLAEVKAEYGRRLAIKGGVPVSPVLSAGTPEQVQAAVRRCLLEAGPGGGYILSSSSDITASVKPENYSTMLEAVREYGRYPLDLERLRSPGGSDMVLSTHGEKE